MSTLVFWVVAIVALGLVIILHELGHYLVAVWTGMKVDRFSVFGIGPVVAKLGTWRGTEFVISAIPFGAYVLIRGMEPEPDPEQEAGVVDGDAIDEDAWAKARASGQAEAAREDSENFRDKPAWARAAVLAGGPVANYLTAMVLFFVVYAVAGIPGKATSIEVTKLAEGKPAEAAGMMVGDELVKIGEAEIDPSQGTQGVVDATEPYMGGSVEVTVLREGEPVVLSVEPAATKPALGAELRANAENISVSTGQAASMAVEQPFAYTRMQLVGLYQLIAGKAEAEMQGPVRIVKHIATSVQNGFIPFLKMAAIISTLLGLFNLLPLPALDGGRLSFVIYEALARRRASARIEEMVHGYGMLVLLVLLLLVTVGDIRSLF